MNKDVPVTVITPEGYGTEKAYPVIYLLHGFSGNQTEWAKEGIVGRLADLYDIIFVLPDGGFDSWYFDSNYSTVKDIKGRAITGLSQRTGEFPRDIA